MQKLWLSVGEIEHRPGVNLDLIYEWINRKKTSARKVGRYWEFHFSEVDEWICNGKAVENE